MLWQGLTGVDRRKSGIWKPLQQSHVEPETRAGRPRQTRVREEPLQPWLGLMFERPTRRRATPSGWTPARVRREHQWVNLVASDGHRSCVFFKPNVEHWFLANPIEDERDRSGNLYDVCSGALRLNRGGEHDAGNNEGRSGEVVPMQAFAKEKVSEHGDENGL
jgi:hypothetical protein